MKALLLLIAFTFFLSASQKPLEKVSVVLVWLDQFQFAGYYMAKEKGFYADAGLEVEIKKFNYLTNVVDEVLDGRATYGVGRSSLIKLRAEGKKVVLLSAIFQSSPFMLISLKSANIKDISDFKNKTLMLTDDAVETASIHAMINSSNVKENDLTLKRHTFNLEELIDGRVDLYAGYMSNEPFILDKKGIEYKIFSPREEGFDFYSDILFTSQKELKNNPKRVKKFKEATLKGWEYAFNNIDESVDLIYEKYNSQKKTKEALAFEAYELKKLAYIKGIELGDINRDKINRILDVYKIMGLAKGQIDLDEFVYTSQNALFTKEQREYLKNKKEIKICVLPNSLPYSAIEGGKYIGIGSEVLAITQKEFDISYKLVETNSWMESLKKGINKECDLLPIASKAPSREHFFKFTTPYHYEPLIIVTKNDKNYISDFETVIDKTFSIVQGHSYVEELKIKYPKIKLKLVKSTKDGLLSVRNAEVYGHIDVLMSCAYWLKHYGGNEFHISGQFDEKIDIGFGIRNDDKILFEIFERISLNFKPSELQKLLDDWVSIDYTNVSDFKTIKRILAVIFILVFIFLYRQYLLKKKNKELQMLQKELQELNRSLEKKIADAVSETIKKDAYLLHQSRLAQMGEMLSMIAHQWKQPLSSISTMQIAMKMSIELEKYDLSNEKYRKDFLNFLNIKLDKIGQYTQNLSHIISDFSDYYRPYKKSQTMRLDSVVVKAYSFIEDNLENNHIALNIDLYSQLMVKIHKNELIQVILNVLNNAKEQLLDSDVEDKYIELKSYDKDGYVILEISDNAGGIDESIISNIFDPYFSTKTDKNGTGLGLYMSKNIIESYHKGTLSVRNYKDMDKNSGAIFTIKIKSEDDYEPNEK